MCTVTYLPKGDDHFLFTSNRDEAPNRNAIGITSEQRGSKTLLFPRDATANGTWIAVSDANQLVCILNGAFVKHKHRPPYRLSRGLMALQFFEYDDAPQFFEEFEFEGMEPFTMIIYDKGKLYDLHWDESDPNIRSLDTTESHIWSSSTLYTPEYQEKREQWFADWKADHPIYTKAGILDFHQHAGEGDPWNDVVMNRMGMIQTVSITSIVKYPEKLEMEYRNLLDDAKSKEQFFLIG